MSKLTIIRIIVVYSVTVEVDVVPWALAHEVSKIP